MGLTIHYGLATDRTDVDAIRALVHDIHRLAKRLPFQDVEDVVEFQDKECGYENQDDPDRWLKIQAGQYLEQGGHCLSNVQTITSRSHKAVGIAR